MNNLSEEHAMRLKMMYEVKIKRASNTCFAFGIWNLPPLNVLDSLDFVFTIQSELKGFTSTIKFIIPQNESSISELSLMWLFLTPITTETSPSSFSSSIYVMFLVWFVTLWIFNGKIYISQEAQVGVVLLRMENENLFSKSKKTIVKISLLSVFEGFHSNEVHWMQFSLNFSKVNLTFCCCCFQCRHRSRLTTWELGKFQ